MRQIATTISWKLVTVLAVVGGGLALSGSYYVGKQVGSSRPPTVIRLPPRMMPMPPPAAATWEPGEADSSQVSPGTNPPGQPRPNKMKRIPTPNISETRSLGTDAKESATDKT